MSTNKTQNYQLHAWGLADEPTLGEVNENFAVIDERLAGKVGIVTGVYTGDGMDTRTIQLGFTPKAVFVITEYADIRAGSYTYGGLALQNQPGQAVAVVDGGFAVRYYSGGNYLLISNGSDRKYYYWALR